MKKNLLALGIILMSALTFTACSDDDDINVMVANNQRYQPQMSMYPALGTLVQIKELLVSLITTYKLDQQHLSYSEMLIRRRMVLVSVMHKT